MKKIIIISILFIVLSSFVYSIEINASVSQALNFNINSANQIDETNQINATINGATFNATGKIGGSYNCDGTNDYIDTNFKFTPTNNLTINFWVKSTDASGTLRLFGATDTSGIEFIRLIFFTTQRVDFDMRDASSNRMGIKNDSATGIGADWNNGSWNMLTFTKTGNDATDLKMYMNGVEQSTVSVFSDTQTNSGQINRDITICDEDNGALPLSPVDMQIDLWTIYDRGINASEVLIHYNNQLAIEHPFFISTIAPNITLISPINNSHENNATVQIVYNVTESIPEVVNCTFFVNNTFNKTFNNINITSNPQNKFNFTASEGFYNYTIQCVNSGNAINSTTRNIFIDRTTPVWTFNTVNTSNTTSIDRGTQNFIFFNDTVNDTYLFAYRVTVRYPNSSTWFFNQTIDLNVSSFTYTRNETITSTQANGTYSVEYYAEDDHTSNIIKNYTIIKDLSKNELIFNSTKNTFTNIKLKTSDIILTNINVFKERDRYSYNYYMDGINNTNHTYIFKISSNDNIYYRGLSRGFPIFVTNKNWIDFNLQTDFDVNYIVTKNKDNYEIKIITKETNLKFRSFGGLNIFNETFLFEIRQNTAPIIINKTPNVTSFSINDGSQLNFSTTATDIDNDTITYEYYFNNVLVNSSQNWTWTVPFNSHGQNNMTVYAIDTSSANISFTWNITIIHVPIVANVTSVSRFPLDTWFTNSVGKQFNCSGFDNDNETQPQNFTVEIDYRSGIFWSSLNVTNFNNLTWVATINLTGLAGETLDVRCRIDDGDFGFTPYTQVNNIVTIQEAYFSVGNVSKVSPSNVNRDFVTSVTCDTNSFGSVQGYKLRYDLDVHYNNTWHNLSYNFFNKALFDMTNVEYEENVSFRCRINDGVTLTAFTNGLNVTRKHITNLFMFDRGNDEIQQSHKRYYKGLYADMHNEIGVTIISSFADCNGDGFWDYYFSYDDDRNTTKEHFLCYNKQGVIKHTVGIFINKSDGNNSLCGFGITGICKLQREYDVLIK